VKRYQEAIQEYEIAKKLGDPQSADEQIQLCRLLMEYEEKLKQSEPGKTHSPEKLVQLARFALLDNHPPEKVLKLSQRAFAAEPELASDLRAQNRYNAACAASLAYAETESSEHISSSATTG